MALPNVTPEQRAKALEKAAQVRKARKELKENIKSGKTDPASVLKTRKDDPLEIFQYDDQNAFLVIADFTLCFSCLLSKKYLYQ